MTDKHNEIKEIAEKRIHKKFRENMSLIVHKVRQGSGTSNHSNTAQIFHRS